MDEKDKLFILESEYETFEKSHPEYKEYEPVYHRFNDDEEEVLVGYYPHKD